MKIKAVLIACILIPVVIISSGFTPTPFEAKEKLATPNHGKNGGMSFTTFLSYFPKTEMPYKLDLADLSFEDIINSKLKSSNRALKRKVNSAPMRRAMFLPEIKGGGFSRMGPPKVEPLARFYPNGEEGNCVAVIYSVQAPYSDSHESFNLMVYDLKGNVIFPIPNPERTFNSSGFQLANRNINTTTTCSIDKSGEIVLRSYKNEWKDNIEEVSFENSQITSYTLTDSRFFKFDRKGKAQKMNQGDMVMMAASK